MQSYIKKVSQVANFTYCCKRHIFLKLYHGFSCFSHQTMMLHPNIPEILVIHERIDHSQLIRMLTQAGWGLSSIQKGDTVFAVD